MVQKIECKDQRHYVEHPLRYGLAAFRLFPIQRGHQPVQTEQDPEIADDSGRRGSKDPPQALRDGIEIVGVHMRLLLELRIPFGLCFPFDSSRQGGNPGPLVANLFAVETHYLVAPGWRVYRCGNSREVLLSRGEELIAARKNAVARFAFENVEQA